VKLNQEKFNILRKVDRKPNFSQREMAKDLDLSLGKINYCLDELRKKGLLKLQNFTNNPKKSKYIYVLTPKGVSEKTKMTIDFMKRKMQEYDELKKELNEEEY
jgi:EPS-associated MarR family transcriptional regulator